MMVEGERFANSPLAHDCKADGIDEAEALVVITAQNHLCLLFEGIIGIDPEKAGTVANEVEETNRYLRAASAPDCFVRLRDNQICCNQKMALTGQVAEKFA